MGLLLKKIRTSYKKNLPFVAYRKPNATSIAAFFQKNTKLYSTEDFLESGFIFAPFNTENQSILIPKNESDFIEEENSIAERFNFKTDFQTDNFFKKDYIKLVKNAIEKIHTKEFKKVVISREELVKITQFDVLETFKKLLQTYREAMVYIWFHPKVGLWFGATPEELLKTDKVQFSTMSLAGTQIFKPGKNVIWKQKEVVEQELVTEFIKSKLVKISSHLEINETETVKAGTLLHLRTRISGELKSKTPDLKTLLNALHPTPAVCGLPREKAKKFILEKEFYERKFYTGFLGELNLNQKSELFVNLRCMRITNNFAHLFIGGGITKDSNPESEWEETVAKGNVMKKVL